jgi:hypothetical protein
MSSPFNLKYYTYSQMPAVVENDPKPSCHHARTQRRRLSISACSMTCLWLFGRQQQSLHPPDLPCLPDPPSAIHTSILFFKALGQIEKFDLEHGFCASHYWYKLLFLGVM